MERVSVSISLWQSEMCPKGAVCQWYLCPNRNELYNKPRDEGIIF